MPTPQENRRLAEEFIEEVFNKKNLAYLEDALADDFVEESMPPGMPNDRAAVLEFFRAMIPPDSDMRVEIIQTIASEDRVAIHTRTTGTDTVGMMPGMEPTGKRYDVEGIDVTIMGPDGKTHGHYGITDMMTAMVQLELMPPPFQPEG